MNLTRKFVQANPSCKTEGKRQLHVVTHVCDVIKIGSNNLVIMHGTLEERHLAMEMLGNILRFAMQEDRWLDGLDRYKLYDDTDQIADDKVVGLGPTALLRALWTRYDVEDLADFTTLNPIVNSIRLQYLQKPRGDIDPRLDPHFGKGKRRGQETSQKHLGEPKPTEAVYVWEPRFKTLVDIVFSQIVDRKRLSKESPSKLGES